MDVFDINQRPARRAIVYSKGGTGCSNGIVCKIVAPDRDVLPIAAINGHRGRFPIGLSGGIVAEHIISRTPHQGDIRNIMGRVRTLRLEVVVRNGVIARAAIKGDGKDPVTRGEGVAADGVIPRPAIKGDGVYIITRSESVVADGVIAIPAIKNDRLDFTMIIIGEGVVTDGVIARTAIQIYVGEIAACRERVV